MSEYAQSENPVGDFRFERLSPQTYFLMGCIHYNPSDAQMSCAFLVCVGTQKRADRNKERRSSSNQKGSVEMPNHPTRKRYPSDVTDAQWEILAPLIPEPGAY
jgi:hypothetical protein